MSERVTLLTLARDLGVSRATVSNAYNRPDQLSADLRDRILARADQLGFAGPDPRARGLRSGRTGAV
ncbi:MAG: LacI family DNA-binding transcriptional regulator, partial [Actinomycetota bacterium]|nr:LacI family DNA-binding transcriptional regulator [Actinomycetota bacterium]